jgi:GNAT superfamily N-acetyltransferase
MEYELLGWPDDGVRLALDYRAFSYAGKFVVSNTGKVVALDPDADPFDPADSSDAPPPAAVEDAVDPGPVVGAVAFNGDRSDADAVWLRYVTVRRDRRGEGVGPRLVAFTTARLRERGYERVRIAVNNPFAYEALYRAGFAFTGEATGVAELVLASPPGDRSRATYQAGFDAFRERATLDGDERAFLDRKRGADPPAVVDQPG